MTGSPKIKGALSSLGKEIHNYIKQANNNVEATDPLSYL